MATNKHIKVNLYLSPEANMALSEMYNDHPLWQKKRTQSAIICDAILTYYKIEIEYVDPKDIKVNT